MTRCRNLRRRAAARRRASAGLRTALAILVAPPVPAARAAEAPPYRGMAVSVTKVARHCFKNRIAVSGVLVPKAEFQVRPDQDGMVVGDVLVEPGDIVVKGQNLVRLVQPPGAPIARAAVKAPVAGVVTQVAAVVGAYSSSTAAPPMIRIVAKGELVLKADVLGRDLARIAVGQPVAIRIKANDVLPAKVASKDPTIDGLTQLGSVRIGVEGEARLTPGAFARAEIDAGEVCGPAVPLSAVLYGAEGIIVQVVQDGRVETRRVTVGLLDKQLAEIRDGAADGSVVITRAGPFLREGDRIRPVEDATAAPR